PFFLWTAYAIAAAPATAAPAMAIVPQGSIDADAIPPGGVTGVGVFPGLVGGAAKQLCGAVPPTPLTVKTRCRAPEVPRPYLPSTTSWICPSVLYWRWKSLH